MFVFWVDVLSCPSLPTRECGGEKESCSEWWEHLDVFRPWTVDINWRGVRSHRWALRSPHSKYTNNTEKLNTIRDRSHDKGNQNGFTQIFLNLLFWTNVEVSWEGASLILIKRKHFSTSYCFDRIKKGIQYTVKRERFLWFLWKPECVLGCFISV